MAACRRRLHGIGGHGDGGFAAAGLHFDVDEQAGTPGLLRIGSTTRALAVRVCSPSSAPT
jgi:hypothetical protein